MGKPTDYQIALALANAVDALAAIRQWEIGQNLIRKTARRPDVFRRELTEKIRDAHGYAAAIAHGLKTDTPRHIPPTTPESDAE
jgi:hypothetical protein